MLSQKTNDPLTVIKNKEGIVNYLKERMNRNFKKQIRISSKKVRFEKISICSPSNKMMKGPTENKRG